MEAALTPYEKRIADGMSPIAAFFTDATCGEACWEARELVCRCSCGGKNHGCMLIDDQKRPERTSKINGIPYRFVSAGSYSDVMQQWDETMKTAPALKCDCPKEHKPGLRDIESIKTYDGSTILYHYYWKETDRDAPFVVKSASKPQKEKWPELKSAVENQANAYSTVYVLWQKI